MWYIIILCAVCLLLAVIARSSYENSHFIEKKYVFPDEKIETPVKLLFLSDLHNNTFGKENEKLIRKIRQEAPDVILLGGDLIIGKGKRVKTEHALAFLRQIQDICPVLYTFGNHETRVKHTREFQEYRKAAEKLSIEILNNRGISMELRGQKFYFYGLELENSQYKRKQLSGVRNPFAGRKEEQGEIHVLLAHTPNFFESYAEWNPDYIFSGHNHGGIVRLPFLGGIISTEHKLFPAYSYGIYKRNKTTMILSAGAGTHTIRFRLFNPSEMVLVQMEHTGNCETLKVL